MPRRHAEPQVPWTEYEAEVLYGLEGFAEEELRRRLGRSARLEGRTARGRIAFSYAGPSRRLGALRSVVAIHRVETFGVPRPRALLGHQHLTRLLGALDDVIARQPAGAFRTLRLSAAGAGSPVFRRLIGAMADHTRLAPREEQADLQIAVRPAPRSGGWQVLVRLTPRPLSARDWRVCNMPGALNATVAHVMVSLAGPTPEERFANLACGSATLLVERLRLGPAALALGIDVDRRALECGRANLEAAGLRDRAPLLLADAARLPLAGACCDTLVADLPYGMLVGSERENRRLYPALLDEAARVAAPGAACALVTAGYNLLDEVLERHRGRWEAERIYPVEIPVERGYLQTRIYLLRRLGS